jgi:hypothetical protein
MVVVLRHTKIKKVTLEKKSTRGKIVSDILNRIMRYESGEMIDDNEVFALFQELVNTGLAWKLQGHYGRQAKALIEQGYVVEVDNNAES